jgi:hypothetical protein
MLSKTWAYDLAKCDYCDKFIIYKAENGMPEQCPKCGVPANHSLTREELEAFRKAQERQEFINNHGTNTHTFYVRRG